jgi:hypothetical protein
MKTATQPAKIYSIFSGPFNSKMQEIKAFSLPMHCLVYQNGYGREMAMGAIFEGPNSNGDYKAVRLSKSDPGFFSLGRASSPASKKFGIGTYYDDAKKIVSSNQVTAAILRANAAEMEKEIAQAAAHAAKLADLASLPARYPHLTPVKDHYSFAEAKANLSSDLKKNFPAIKFSLRKSGWDTININWIDGPTKKEVEDVVKKYQGYERDETGDFWDPAPSNFNNIFGDFKFVFAERSKSEATQKCFEKFETMFQKSHYYEHHEMFNAIFSRSSMPAAKHPVDIVENDKTSCSFSEKFDFVLC